MTMFSDRGQTAAAPDAGDSHVRPCILYAPGAFNDRLPTRIERSDLSPYLNPRTGLAPNPSGAAGMGEFAVLPSTEAYGTARFRRQRELPDWLDETLSKPITPIGHWPF